MNIQINIDDSISEDVLKAFKRRFGFADLLPNPNPKPEAILAEDGSVSNQEEIDSYSFTIPNPISNDEFLKACLVTVMSEWLAMYKVDVLREEMANSGDNKIS